MPKELEKQFRDQIKSADTRLRDVTEEAANREIRDVKWSGKEVLGHLIDSALDNHQRFVRAALDGAYEGPDYEPYGWVNLHGYGELSWRVLLEQWRSQNELLARVVGRIPDASLNARCRVGEAPPVTLAFLIEDYLRHMNGHVAQITGA